MKRVILIALLLSLAVPSFAASKSGDFDVWLSSLKAVNTTGAGDDYRLVEKGFYKTWTAISWKTSFTGTPTSITVQLRGSNDNGVTWDVLDSSTSTAGESKSVTGKFYDKVQCNISAIVANGATTNCDVKGIGTANDKLPVSVDADGTVNFSKLAVGATVLAKDGAVQINVKAFGAKGDGTTDDTTAITNAIAAIPAAGGTLYFPNGTYKTSGGFTLANPVTVLGDAVPSEDLVGGSQIVCTSATAVLFTVTAKTAKFQNIGLINTNATPTAGAAIYANGTYVYQQVDYDTIVVSGFYDDVHVGVGAHWSMRGSVLLDARRYGLYVENTVNADVGDWAVANNFIKGHDSPLATAGIHVASSGGGKIIGNKIIQFGTSGIELNASASGQLLINNNDIEYSGIPVNLINAWPYITVVGNYLNATTEGQPTIWVSNANGLIISGNTLQGSGAAAIVVTGPMQNVRVISNQYGSGFTATSDRSGVTTGNNDFSDLDGITSASTATNGAWNFNSRITGALIPQIFAGTAGWGFGTTAKPLQFYIDGAAPENAVKFEYGTNKRLLLTATLNTIQVNGASLNLKGDANGTAGTGTVIQGYNGSAWQTLLSVLNTSSGNAVLKLSNLPTSCSGMAAGTVWNNSGALGVCP